MRGTFFDVFKKKFSKSLSDCDRRPSRGTFFVTFKKKPGVSVLIVLPLLHIQYSKTVSNSINNDVYLETILDAMMVKTLIDYGKVEKFTLDSLNWILSKENGNFVVVLIFFCIKYTRNVSFRTVFTKFEIELYRRRRLFINWIPIL